MKAEIKKRIEQINCGEIPNDYKNTIVGVIPNDWNIIDLIETTKNGISNGIFNDPDKVDGNAKLINVVNLYDEPKIYVDKLSTLSITESEAEAYKVNKYDIFFTRSSLKLEGIAHCNIITDEIENVVYDCHIMKISPNTENYNPKFLCNAFKLKKVRRQFMLRAKTTTMTTIGQKDISDIKIPYPCLAEQHKISEILSKWDEAVALQSELIDKIELQRKGLIQKLLYPRKGWKKVSVGELTKEVSVRNKNNDCFNIKSVSNKLGFINQDEQFSKQVASQDLTNYKKVSRGDIAYNPSRINVGSIALYNDNETGIISPMYVVFRCEKISPELLLLILSTNRGKYDIQSFLAGSVRDSLNYSDLENVVISIPDEETQEKLVKFFSLLDEKITNHKNKLAGLKKQQKAMQQLLLTGIVRVN